MSLDFQWKHGIHYYDVQVELRFEDSHNRSLPSGYVKIAIENGPVEIVDLPSYKIVDLSM
jgi:hypothetical protein